MSQSVSQNNKIDIPLLQECKEDNEKAIISKLNKRIVPITFLIVLLLFTIRNNIIYVASDFCEAFNLNYSEFGIGTSLFNISYTIFVIPGGMLLSKLKLTTALGISLFFNGLLSCLLAFAQNKYHFYIIRILLGISQAGTVPIILDYISRIFPAKNKLFAYGFASSAPQFSRTFGAILALGFLSIDIAFGFYGWQWLLFIEGLLTALFLIIPIIFLPLDIHDLKQFTYDEKNWLLNHIEIKNDEDDGKADFRSNLINVIKIRNFWLLNLASSFRTMCFVGFNSFVTLIISEMLGNNQEEINEETCKNESSGAIASILTAIPYIFTGLSTILLGKYGKHIKNKPLCMSIMYIISSIFILVWIFVQDYLIFGLSVLTLASAFGNSIYPLQISLIDSFIDKKNKVLGLSLNNTIGLIGSILGPILTGVAVDLFGFNGSMCFMIGSLLIAAILTCLIRIKD